MAQKNKSHLITARATEDELAKIKENAALADQSISRYMVDCASKVEGLHPTEKRKAYHHLLLIQDLATHWEQFDDPQLPQKINKECMELCQLLNLFPNDMTTFKP